MTKQLYIIGEISYNYNDENYSRGEKDSIIPKKAWTDKEKADKECEKLNKESRKNNSKMEDDEGNPITEFFEVIPVEVEDTEAKEKTVSIGSKTPIKKQMEKAIVQKTKELFKAIPKMKYFSWNQSTPSWCDGDPCTFRVNSESIEINGQTGYYDNEEEAKEAKEEFGDKEFNLVGKFVESMDEDELLFVFGDNVEVTIHKNSGKVDITDFFDE